MKDEEMAEEYANKRCHEIMCYGHCSFNSPKHHRCGAWHREYNCALAGLKAGRPQWHDLRKDKNDLPKKELWNKQLLLLVIAPCKMCKHSRNRGKRKSDFLPDYDRRICELCCWYYDSKFKIEVDDNSCATCRHKAKMLTDKKPCVDCDNGCNWEADK